MTARPSQATRLGPPERAMLEAARRLASGRSAQALNVLLGALWEAHGVDRGEITELQRQVRPPWPYPRRQAVEDEFYIPYEVIGDGRALS